MKKLLGLLVFVAAVASAIALTRYYSSPSPERTPKASPPPHAQASPPPPAGDTPAQPVTFKVQRVTLNLATGEGRTTLLLERDASSTPPRRLWVWTYFFAPDAPGERRYCAGEPAEVQPLYTEKGVASVDVTAKVTGCAAASSPSATYYARVNVSDESAFAARLSEGRISYDVSQAVPVRVEQARPSKR